MIGASDITSINLNTFEIKTLLGKLRGIENYVKQGYISVFKITSVAIANTLAKLTQKYICGYLKVKLGYTYNILDKSIIGDVSHNDRETLLSSDTFVKKEEGGKSIVIEKRITCFFKILS
ncbi:MAG: hypothetical protein F3740_09190 [Nitrospinae bacterium]|nr:hypothetical protein [Nitrospinota bacterium]